MKSIDQMNLHRLLQNINWYGYSYTFNRKSTNEYGEKNGDESKAIMLRGLFHSKSNHLNLTTSDGNTVQGKNTYQIMSTWENVKNIRQEDTVQVNNDLYKVTAIENVAEKSIVGEISLELILQ